MSAVPLRVAIIYNDPRPELYAEINEAEAELEITEVVQPVQKALDELGHITQLVPLTPPLEQVREKLASLDVDVVFNLFEGFDGYPQAEAQVAYLLEKLKIPYTGCPGPALELGLNKPRAKVVLETAGIWTPKFQILDPHNLSAFKLDYPCIVKPFSEDASHGLSENSVVYDIAGLERQVREVSRVFGGKALVEEFLEGREFNTTVMGNGTLKVPAISEIVYTLPPDKPRVLTFDAKWRENTLYYQNTEAVCPAAISESEKRKISRIARSAFRLFGCRGYARVDFRQDTSGNLKVLEVNPNPDLTPGSGAARQAAAAGMTYAQFVEKVLRFAMKHHESESKIS
jgi:D-alanine-D-alanine ligase